MVLPIDPEIIKKRSMIPGKIAELSYIDPDAAMNYLRIWGERKLPATVLYQELISVLGQKTS